MSETESNSLTHTPGPWDWATLGNDIGIMATGDEPFCRLRTREETYDQALADAKLIAAAPELLAALKVVAGSENWRCSADEEWDIVNAAIAKAEGRNPA
jgi:hypothetical protein